MGNLHNRHSPIIQYSRGELLSLRQNYVLKFDRSFFGGLRACGIFKYRGKRSGKRVKLSRNIPVIVPRRFDKALFHCRSLHNLIPVKKASKLAPVTSHRFPVSLPSVLICNARSLQPKVDELECIAENNNADVICVTETWLSEQIPDTVVNMRDYILFPNYRPSHAKQINLG